MYSSDFSAFAIGILYTGSQGLKQDEILSLAVSINIKAFNCVNKKTAEHSENNFRISGKSYCCLLKMIQLLNKLCSEDWLIKNQNKKVS